MCQGLRRLQNNQRILCQNRRKVAKSKEEQSGTKVEKETKEVIKVPVTQPSLREWQVFEAM